MKAPVMEIRIILTSSVFILCTIGKTNADPELKSSDITVLGRSSTSNKLFVFVNRKVSWNEGRLACESYDLTMASMENERENREVYAYLASLEPVSDVWIGGNDVFENGNYFWGLKNDSSINYFDWICGNAQHSPNPHFGCISILHQPGNSCGNCKCSGWKESVCSEPKYTLCMLDLNKISLTSLDL